MPKMNGTASSTAEAQHRATFAEDGITRKGAPVVEALADGRHKITCRCEWEFVAPKDSEPWQAILMQAYESHVNQAISKAHRKAQNRAEYEQAEAASEAADMRGDSDDSVRGWTPPGY